MFWHIVKFEISYRLKRPATYIYFGLFLLIAFGMVASPNTSFAESGDKINNNAPVMINQLILAIMLFGTLVCAAIMGVPVYRDYDHKFYEIMHSLPISKAQYLWGRFTGSYIISVLIFLGIGLGMMIGFAMPWQESDSIGTFLLASYINSYVFFVLPNLFIFGTLFFIAGSYFRSQTAIYAQGIIFLVLYTLIGILLDDADSSSIASIFDPFGSEAIAEVTKYWTTYEKNSMPVGLSGYVLLNRILWTSLAAGAALVFTWLFKPGKASAFSFRRKKQGTKLEDSNTDIVFHEEDIIAAGWKSNLLKWQHLTSFYFKEVIRSIPFLIMVACGIGFMLLARMSMGMVYGVSTLPVTYMLMDTLAIGFLLFLNIIIIVYTGELIWKDISSGFSLIIDSSPLSNANILLSKFSAMVIIELLLMVVIILSGIGVQVYEGFFDFQLGIYVKFLMLNIFPILFLMTFLTFFVHTLSNNKFLGHGIVIGLYLLRNFSGMIGVNHILFKYGQAPTESYSGMNGLQKFVSPALTLDFYWLMLGIVLLVLTFFYIKRGTETNFGVRTRVFFQNMKQSRLKYAAVAALILFVSSGYAVYYNTNVLNTYRTKKESRSHAAEYEKRYKQFENYPQPRITDVNLEVDIFPTTYGLKARGQYRLVNKSGVTIDSLHVRTLPELNFTSIEFNRKTTLVHEAPEYGYYIHQLSSPLLPGDSLSLSFSIDDQERGFSNRGRRTELVPNGTFFRNEILPYFGYDERIVLTKKRDRKKEGLDERTFESAELTDTSAYGNTYISQNADRISYEAIVSTNADQIALTCGDLVDEWTTGDRRYFHYKMKEPMWNFAPFLSAKYKILRDSIGSTGLEIYYHPEHDYNVEKMMDAAKKTLTYCGDNFSPYQHSVLRIVEFPRYSMYAQSFAGIIPFSEGIGFITEVDEENDIDVPFYVTAHEIAHQWWGHHICAADVKGKLLLVESLANYTALMVMEQESGTENIAKFLKYEQNNYLLGRSMERKKESPLYLVDDQTYIAYNKGSVNLYALRNLIGEDSLNSALSEFMKAYSYREAPYPTSIDLLSRVEKVVPDTLSYLLEDMFRTITLFGNRIDSAYYRKTEDGNYLVQLNATAEKFRADSLGKQDSVAIADWIDIGVFAESSEGEDSLAYLERVRVETKELKHTITVDFIPVKVGIDPQHMLIDRKLEDNIKTIKEKG